MLGRRNTGLEEAARDLEPLGEPLEGSIVGTYASALDLADVLLREAVEAELGLSQAARDTQLA